MEFVDTHVHLDDDAFAEDIGEILEASRGVGVNRWINVGYNEQRWASTIELVGATSGMSCMLGLHPGYADDWSDSLRDRLHAAIDGGKPVAIGEIGLDLYWRKDNLEIQREAFVAQLEVARERGLPAVIHMRDADVHLLDCLESMSALPHIHFHSFDGHDALREWVVRHNATIGVGGLITRRGSETLQTWVSTLPTDRVVLETDSPYLKPRGIRGRRNQPAYMVKVARLLAELWGTDLDTVASTTTANAFRIFGLEEGFNS